MLLIHVNQRKTLDSMPWASNIAVLKNILLVSSGLLVVSIAVTAVSISNLKDTNAALTTRVPTEVDSIARAILDGTDQVTLPARFVVSGDYILPPSDQMSRGTCWDFATIFLLESQYRANGIRYGFLNKSEYVTFSKQAYGAYLLTKCDAAKPKPGPCQHGGLPHNTTDDHKIPSLYYFLEAFPDLGHSILPESICPYQPTDSPDNDRLCPGMWEAVKTNPIVWRIKSIEAAVDINAAKRLLVRKQRPLGLSMPIGTLRYFAPCDGNGSSYTNRPQCNESRRVKCPSSYAATYCAAIDIFARNSPDGTFTAIEDWDRFVFAEGGHEMDIVAYNDDWVYRSRRESFRTLGNVRGAFIVHNSWRSPGHSVDYYMGLRSEENDAVICPNHGSSTNWIPATFDCITNHSGDWTKCGTGIQRIRGKGLTSHADLLKCTNADYCNVSKNYVIESRPIGTDVYAEPLFSGFDLVHVISWTPGQNDYAREQFDFLPFYMLGSIFVPDPATFVPNDETLCGYWSVPYYALEMSQKKNWNLLDNFHAVDIEFEFENKSYAKSGTSGQDYSLIKSSTHTFTDITFDGPLPYRFVYPAPKQ
jgi:hypothetical protein